MPNTSDFYFKSYAEWQQAITVKCNIKLTADYIRSRISSLQNSSDKTTKEFTDKYGEVYLQQVIQWFEQAEKNVKKINA